MQVKLESAADEPIAATVYSGQGCTGKSSLLTMSSDSSVEPGVFEQEDLNVGGDIKSVFIQAGSLAEVLLLP